MPLCIGRLLASPASINLSRKNFPGTKHSTLFCGHVSDEEKKFCNILVRSSRFEKSGSGDQEIHLRITRCQCHKTFYRGNLPPFHGNTVILCYKAILPLKLPWNGSKLPQYFNHRKSKVRSTAVIYRGIVLKHWPQVSML